MCGDSYCLSVAVAVAAAFKAGKIQNNPFSQASTAGGAAIPPPSNIAGRIIYNFNIFSICFPMQNSLFTVGMQHWCCLGFI